MPKKSQIPPEEWSPPQARAYDHSPYPGGPKHKQLILVNKEDHYRLSELAEMLPDKPCYETVRKWCKVGVEMDGRPVMKMEYIISPVGWRSSVEAYYRFLKRLNDWPPDEETYEPQRDDDGVDGSDGEHGPAGSG